MLVSFGCDHAGFSIKSKIIEFINKEGHKVIDCGCFGSESCDYPDFALDVCEYVRNGKCERGILLCGTGIGMSIAANKIPGIRAGVCYSDEVAKLIREHNDTNVLCLPARIFEVEHIFKWIKIWLDTPFSNDERHRRRIQKIDGITRRYCKI